MSQKSSCIALFEPVPFLSIPYSLPTPIVSCLIPCIPYCTSLFHDHAYLYLFCQEQRRPVLDKEEKIDFYPQWKQQQRVREEKEERERRHRISKERRDMQGRREENKVEEEGKNTCQRGKMEDYTSNGEGRKL